MGLFQKDKIIVISKLDVSNVCSPVPGFELAGFRNHECIGPFVTFKTMLSGKFPMPEFALSSQT